MKTSLKERKWFKKLQTAVGGGEGASDHSDLTGNSGAGCHPIGAITGLQDALDAKAASNHNHDGSYAAAGHNHDGTYSPVGHTHEGGSTAWGGITGTLSNQTDLQTALDGKSGTGHNHDAAYSAVGHNHDAAYSAVGHNHAGVYEPANANIQAHVSSTSNPHSVTKTQVGLGNVDNTSDASKPVSTATQTALNGKLNTTAFSGLTKITVGTTQPVAPSVGDLWVDTN